MSFRPTTVRIHITFLEQNNHEPGLIRSVTVLTLIGGVWYLSGRLLENVEFIRLLWYNNAEGTVTLRFSTHKLAERARSMRIADQG